VCATYDMAIAHAVQGLRSGSEMGPGMRTGKPRDGIGQAPRAACAVCTPAVPVPGGHFVPNWGHVREVGNGCRSHDIYDIVPTGTSVKLREF